jgi:hypothetical protein
MRICVTGVKYDLSCCMYTQSIHNFIVHSGSKEDQRLRLHLFHMSDFKKTSEIGGFSVTSEFYCNHWQILAHSLLDLIEQTLADLLQRRHNFSSSEVLHLNGQCHKILLVFLEMYGWIWA